MKKLISVLILAVMLTANLMSVNCFASDEWIYYSNSKDIHRPYRIKSNGTEMTRLSLETAYDLTPLGSYVYYHNNSEFGAIFRTKNDGSETECIADGIREQCRGIAKNNRNVFVLYETNNNAGNSEYVEPYLTLCIYDKKGKCTKTDLTCYDLVESKLVEIAGADNKYLYFSIKNANALSYKKMKINSDSDIQFKDCKETELPTMTEPTFDIPEGYFRNKYLCWKRADNAVAYRVFKMSGSDGKYKQIAETTDTFIDLCVKDTEYNDKFKVYAVKEKNGKNKLCKVSMLSSENNFGNTAGNISNSPFTVVYDNYAYISERNRIIKINTESGKKIELWNGDDTILLESARYLNIFEDKLFFFGRYSDLCCIDTNGKNIDIMPDFCSSMGIAPDDLSDYDFDIHSIAVCNGLLYASYHLEKGNKFDHTAVYDINTEAFYMINDFSISQMGFAENKIVFISDNDKLIYSTSLSSKETVCISEEAALSMYIDNQNNKLYYCNEKGVFMSETDGTNCVKIYSGRVKAVNSDGKKLYFIRDDQYRKNYVWNSRLTAWSIEYDGKNPEMITDVSSDSGFMSFNIIGEKMYVLYSDENVYSYSLKK